MLMKNKKLPLLSLSACLPLMLWSMDREPAKRPAEQELKKASKESKLISANVGNLLLKAALENDFNTAANLLSAGADFNACDENKRTSLYIAAKKGYTDIVRFLLNKGADFNMVPDDDPFNYGNGISDSWMGATPLHVAAGYGHEHIVGLLLAKGANVNAHADLPDEEDYDGWTEIAKKTPLHMAVWLRIKSKDALSIARLLLDKGADVNAKDAWGFTPLCDSLEMTNPAILQLLLDRGAVGNSRDIDGNETQLCIATRVGLKDDFLGLQLLLELAVTAPLTEKDVLDMLHTTLRRISSPVRLTDAATMKKKVSTYIRLMALYGQPIPPTVSHELWPLEGQGPLPVEINALDTLKSQLNNLEYAAAFDEPKKLKNLLVQYNLKALDTPEALSSALMWAAARAHKDNIALLIQRTGVNAKRALNVIISILMQSVGVDYEAMFNTMVKNRIDPVEAYNNINNSLKNTITTLDINYSAIFDIILNGIPEGAEKQELLGDLLKKAVRAGSIPVSFLLRYNAPLDKALTTLDSLVAVPVAPQYRNALTIISKFLMARAKLSEQILRTQRPGVLQRLIKALEQGAAPSDFAEKISTRAKHNAALEKAAIYDYFKAVRDSNIFAAQTCLYQGIDPNARNDEGKTALWIAVERNDSRMVKFLLSNKKVVPNPLNVQTGQTLSDIISQKSKEDPIKIMLLEHTSIDRF